MNFHKLFIKPLTLAKIFILITLQAFLSINGYSKETNPEYHTYSGVIHSNLLTAGRKSGMKYSDIYKLADIFAWDINFNKDVRDGDRFTAVIQKNGNKSKIVAAAFVNKGREFSAFLFNFAGENDYYDAFGHNMRKSFLQAPLKYRRISSKFSEHRKHPILGYTRAHHGVDYAANYGTPVHAVADGVIISRGKHGGYGNFIKIRHPGGVITAYGHLSRFSNKKKAVKQGDVIGYVGSTGISTGPHLHFEFIVNGKAVNPLIAIKEYRAADISGDKKQVFLAMKSKISTLMTGTN